MEADKHLENELSKYSSSFSVMKDIGILTQKYLKLKRDGSIEKLDEFDTKMETYRTYNLISFLCFLVGNIEDALDYNKKSLDLLPDNIIGLSNRGWFMYKTNQNFGEIRQLCKTLSAAQKDPSKTIVAKAEIAFTYSRLGIQFYRKASHIYQDALAEAKCQHVSQLSDNFEEYICLWSFESALAQSRLFTTFNVCNASDLEITRKHYVSVCELSREIINAGEKSMTVKRLRSRAYVLLGIVADDIKLKKELFPDQMKSILPEDTELHLTPDEYFEEALKLQNNDVFVLDHCGQHFRFTSNLDKAIRLLKESISIKASSMAHHHLALALNRRLEMSFTKGPCFAELGHIHSTAHDPSELGNIHSTADEPSDMTREESKQKEDSPPAREIMGSSSDQMVGEDSGAMSLFTHKRVHELYSGNTHGGGNHSCIHISFENEQLTTPANEQTISQGHHRSEPRARNKPVQWRMINCPKKMQIIDYFANKAAVDEIIHHLEIASDLRMNNNAIYDKGLLLRQTNQVVTALDVFKSLVRNEHHRCSLVLLANAYEQAGFCLQELLASSYTKNEENYEEDMKMYFKKSLEISCNIVAKLSELENCWDSAPTLKSFLLGKAKTKQNLKDLLFLYKKMKAYEDAVGVLSRLLAVVDTEEEQDYICREIIDQYLKMKRFDEAVLTLQILMCLPKTQDHSLQKLLIEVYIEGALDALKKGEKDLARLRFDNALT